MDFQAHVRSPALSDAFLVVLTAKPRPEPFIAWDRTAQIDKVVNILSAPEAHGSRFRHAAL